MANFKPAYVSTMGIEGGIADDPDDAGGFTYKGITTRDWPNWAGWPIVRAAIKATKTRAQANQSLAANADLQTLVYQFYKKNYWDVHNLDAMTSQAIAEELFDSSVNCGNETAGEWLQNAINQAEPQLTPKLKPDGVVGNTTIRVCNASTHWNAIYNGQNQQQKDHYLALAKKNPKYKKFLASWLSRVHFRAL